MQMQEGSWKENSGSTMMANGTETNRGRIRSQDDATVGYYYQRPQNDNVSQQYGSKKWATGDDSVVVQVKNI